MDSCTGSDAGLIVQPEESGKVRSPDVIYVPTPQPVVDEMLRLAKVKSGDIFMDLGCGDGRIPISAAKLGAWGFGYDIDGERIKDSVENAKKAGVVGRVVFEQRDVFKLDLRPGRRGDALPAPFLEREADPATAADEARHADRVARLRHGWGRSE
jgi:SAM-dependent methyltransferase